MNNILKVTFLVFLLAIPVAIVLFLEYFGENQFNIPVYYQNGVTIEDAGCAAGEGAFTVPDSLLNAEEVSLVIFFKPNPGFSTIALNNQIRRLRELFEGESFDIIVYASVPVEVTGAAVRMKEDINTVMACGFVTQTFNQYVLVDKRHRIRGYYNNNVEEPERLEEIDRMIVELRILLENGGS